VPVSLHYEIDGAAEVEHDLLGMGMRFLEPRPVLGLIADALRASEIELFDSDGKGTWPPLAAATIARKGNADILEDTDALRASLTEKDAAGHFEIIQGSELMFGTGVVSEDGTPYARFHKTGTKHMPKRDPLFIDESDMVLFSKAIQAYLVGAERSEFGALTDSGTFFTGETTTFGVG
jgi:hypothetical protein